MAETIDNFLIGIGFNYDDSGAQRIQSSFGSIKSRALQLGAAVTGALSANALTFGFAERTDEIGKFSQALGVVPGQVAALNLALRQFGGSEGEIFSQLEAVARLREGLLSGDVDQLSRAQAVGIDPSSITNAENAVEAYIAAISQLERFGEGSDQQRATVRALGLSQASQLLGNEGEEEVRAIVDRFAELRPVTEEMTRTAAEFNDAMLDLTTNIGRVADNISGPVLNSLTGFANSVSGFLVDNRESIDDFVESPGRFYLENAPSSPIPFSDYDLFRAVDFLLASLGNEEARLRREAFKSAEEALSPASIGDPVNAAQDNGGEGVLARELGSDYQSTALDLFNQVISEVDPFSIRPLSTPGAPLPQSGDSGSFPKNITVNPSRVDANITLTLDGKIVDQRVERFIGQQNSQTLSDLQTDEDAE